MLEQVGDNNLPAKNQTYEKCLDVARIEPAPFW